MPAAVRGRGLLIAIGFPSAALVVVSLWLELHGAVTTTPLVGAAVMVVVAALADQIDIVVSPRMTVSPASGFLVAAALIGGPLVGACAGVALEVLNTDHVWRRRLAWGGAEALEGFGVGLVGWSFALPGAGGALALATLGLLTGMALNWLNVVVVALDRPGNLRSHLAGWRAHLLSWTLPWPPLAAFLFSYRLAPSVALALASGLLLPLWLGNRLRLRLEQRLAEERSRARVDAITGAPNRYALAEALTAEHGRITRGARPAALCFVDLDRFREVNNTYGYLAGDELLVDVYRRLREGLRVSDGVFRWGGEEFVVLGPDQSELASFAERLRLLVSAEPFAIHGEPRVVTCSVGAARLDDSRGSDATLETASRLVRVAKQRRNAIEVETAVTPSASRGGAAQPVLEAT